MEKNFNLKSGIFTLLSVSVHEIAEDLRSAKVTYKLLADGAAGEIKLTDRTRLTPSRSKDILHGYVVRGDKRKFEIIYNVAAEELSCKIL